MKKPAFLLPFARLFTRGMDDAYDSTPFKASESVGDEPIRALTAPDFWSDEAVAVMAAAAAPSVPLALRASEENTVPSWLWRRRAMGASRATENDIRDIFNRIVGAAGAKSWQLGLFSSEKHARAFYDEARYALIQRHIAIAPDCAAAMGLGWAYGLPEPPILTQKTQTPSHNIFNKEIDAALKSKKTPETWQKILSLKAAKKTGIVLRFNDIADDWHSAAPTPAGAAIDVMAFRHNDGSVNVDAIKQATRLLVILLDMHDRNDVTVTVANLAPLLLALGLGYDSDAGRAMAASLMALITAAGLLASAEMAALRGAGQTFADEREEIMRSLRNHRRAVYGDNNDYEKLSVLPAPLPLKNCPDLALVAEAQRQWDEAIVMARVYGLRRLLVTDMTPNAALTLAMASASQGLMPMRSLKIRLPDETETCRAALHPAAGEALARLGYARGVAKSLAHHVAGVHSLQSAPAINHRSLRAAGLSATAIEKIEAYLPYVDSVRWAITPWVIGIDFCHDSLKIPAKKIDAPRFDLLAHLGFDDAAVAAANLYCYGHGTARNAKILNLRHRALFACDEEISNEARLRMAAATQSFISCDTGIVLTLPVTGHIERGAEMFLAAWQGGLKSVKIIFDETLSAPSARPSTARRLAAHSHATAAIFKTPSRLPRGKKPATPLAVKKSPDKRAILSSGRRGGI